MKKKMTPLRNKGFHILFFALGLLLFSWPVLSIAGSRSTGVFFAYLFLAWAGVIVLLFLIGRHADSTGGPMDGQGETSGADNV